MPATGHWRVTWADGSVTINPGDTASIPAGVAYSLEPAMTGEAAIYRVVATDDPAGPTWRP
jgi:mannose-6-phosphate isomerase-like protein (cupin superfamily)